MQFPDATKITSHTMTIVPRYHETDQAGVVHHCVYPVWFEMGRTELLRANGLAYKDLEAAGIMFVVVELTVRYRRPARYDEPIKLTTICSNVTAAKVEHKYTLTNPAENDVVLAEGSTILACVDREGKVRRMPGFMYPE